MMNYVFFRKIETKSQISLNSIQILENMLTTNIITISCLYVNSGFIKISIVGIIIERDVECLMNYVRFEWTFSDQFQ